MLDAIYIVSMFFAFAVLALYVRGCEKL